MKYVLKNRVSNNNSLALWCSWETDCSLHFLWKVLELTADIQSISVSYHQTDPFLYVLKIALFGRLWLPVTKQISWVWIPLKPEWRSFNIIWSSVRLSAESDLAFSWSVSFSLPLRRWEKAHFTDALNLKHKRIIQQLKQLKKDL